MVIVITYLLISNNVSKLCQKSLVKVVRAIAVAAIISVYKFRLIGCQELVHHQK